MQSNIIDDVKYEFAEFAKGFKIERKLHDDDMYSVINRKPAGLALSAKRTKEKYGASTFNNADAGSGSISVGGVTILNNTEALPLASTAHTSTASSTTQGNYGTTALSSSAIEATRILSAGLKDDRDNMISINMDTLLIPRNLEETAWTIINTTGKVDSADNNKNFHYGKYKLAVWDYLTGTKTWFMIDQTMCKMYLNWYTRVPLEFNQDKSFDTYIAKYSAYERYGWGWSDWRWLYMHKVA